MTGMKPRLVALDIINEQMSLNLELRLALCTALAYDTYLYHNSLFTLGRYIFYGFLLVLNQI